MNGPPAPPASAIRLRDIRRLAQPRQCPFATVGQLRFRLIPGRWRSAIHPPYNAPARPRRRRPARFAAGFDKEASPPGAKGLGELILASWFWRVGLGEMTAVSVAPAIAGPVHHAAGGRVRDLPITTKRLF
jgi:hypothetical protein